MKLFASIILILGMIVPNFSRADAVAVAAAEGIRIVLHDDKCGLSTVSNLPAKATWTERGVITEGCWGIQPALDIVMLFFADKTVVVVPRQIFTKLQES